MSLLVKIIILACKKNNKLIKILNKIDNPKQTNSKKNNNPIVTCNNLILKQNSKENQISTHFTKHFQNLHN